MGDAIADFISVLQTSFDENERHGTESRPERRKLRTVAALCGQRASSRLLTRLDEELRISGIYTEPSLLDTSLKLDDWVMFSKTPFLPDAVYFPKEKNLQDFVEACIGDGPFRNLELLKRRSGREFRLRTGERIDLLCRERTRSGQGAMVAIEFKRKNERGTVEQMIGYLNELRDMFPGRAVRGIIISGLDDPVAASVLKDYKGHKIEWLCYSVKFEWPRDPA